MPEIDALHAKKLRGVYCRPENRFRYNSTGYVERAVGDFVMIIAARRLPARWRNDAEIGERERLTQMLLSGLVWC